MKKLEFVLGRTENNEIVLAEIEKKNYFSVCFSVVHPVEVTADYLEESKEMMLDNFEENTQEFEEIKEFLNSPYTSIEEIIDISLFPYSITLNSYEDDIYFLSSSCGQVDTRNDISRYTDKNIVDSIFKLWDKFHLKNMSELSVIAKKRINVLFEKIERYTDKFDIDNTMQILSSEIMED